MDRVAVPSNLLCPTQLPHLHSAAYFSAPCLSLVSFCYTQFPAVDAHSGYHIYGLIAANLQWRLDGLDVSEVILNGLSGAKLSNLPVIHHQLAATYPGMTSGKEVHNILPDRLKDHPLAGKYKYVDYDEELGMVIRPTGFYVDCLGGAFLIPDAFNTEKDAFETLKDKIIEKGDYLLCCPSKTGQHWVWEIMSMLTAGSAEYINGEKESSWLDIAPLEDIYSRYETGPRVLCSHVAPDWLPQKLRRSDTKVVVTLRNLKDAFVSYYYHYSYFKADDVLNWPDTFKKLMYSKYCAFGTYFDLYSDIWDNCRNDANVLLVFYEDLKRRPEETIEKIANHMMVSHSPRLISSIAEAVHITKMKPAKDKITKSLLVNQSLYRKGEIGGWKELFTVAQNEEFDRVWNEWNKERQMSFIYE